MTWFEIICTLVVSVQMLFILLLMASIGYLKKQVDGQLKIMHDMATKIDANFLIVSRNFVVMDKTVVHAFGLAGSILEGTVTEKVTPPEGMLN